MSLSLEQMIRYVQQRTKLVNNDPQIIDELNEGLDESWKRLYVVCSDVEITFETTGTFAADTQQFDLGAEITAAGGEFYGSKTFYIQGANDDRYIPVVFTDVNDPNFIALDQETAAVLQPCLASLVNFDQIRFAPPMPSGTLWRADWIGKPPRLSLATNCQTSLPDPLGHAVVAYATATIYNTLDDSRDPRWMREFENKLASGIRVIKRRQAQTRQGTQPYPPRSNSGYGVLRG